MNNKDFPDALPSQYRLHWYVLESVLGQGGFGITYLARDTNLDLTVAIKEYLPVEVATRRPDASVRSRTENQHERYRGGLERFIREARTLARFDHPNIVRVHSVFEFNETAYMVMRFEEGETLAALLERRQSLPEAELMPILMPILDGLELVHGAGFIHRDIKPDNIHIRKDGSPVLLDFGSARFALGQSRTVTILVAPGYAPLEQYYNSGETQGPWTDIYGLGATCYRAIAGHAPMDAIARSKGQLGSTHDSLLPARVAGDGRYSEGFLKAIDHALEFAEKDRPQTIAEWRRDLQPAPGVVRSAAVPADRRAAERLIARRRWYWAAAGAVVVAAAFVVGSMMMSREEAPRERIVSAPGVAPGVAAELRKQIAELKQVQSETQSRLEKMQTAPPADPKPAPMTKPQAPVSAQPPAKPPKTDIADTKQAAVVAAARTEMQAPAPLPASAAATPASPPPSPMEVLKSGVEHNDVRAMVKLGDLYLAGDGVEHSDQEALRLFRRAAALGSADAQLRLGDMYSKGRGVSQNNFQAYVWYSAAAQSGNAAARASQERVGTQLQAAELQQAKKLVEAISGSGGR